MDFFINQYPGRTSAYFNSILNDIDQDEILLIGKEDGKGMLVRLDENGEQRWGKSYFLREEEIAIHHYEKFKGGDLLLLGSILTQQRNRIEHLLLRVSLDGDIVWAKRIKTAYSRNNIGLVKTKENEFVFAGWHNVAGSNDHIELIKIDEAGEVLAAKELELGSDTQVLGITTVEGGLALVGGTNAGTPWHAFLVLIDSGFERYTIHLLNHPASGSVEDIQAVYYLPHRFGIQRRILLLGKTRQGNHQRSFLAIAQPNRGEGLEVEAISFDVTNGKDHNRKIRVINDRIFVLGQSTEEHYAYVCCFNMNLQLLWTKKFELEKHILTDIKLKGEDELWLSGYFYNDGEIYQPIVIKTDLDLTSCKTQSIERVEIADFKLEVEQISRKIKDVKVAVKDAEVGMSPHRVYPERLCPTKVFEPDESSWLQSPYLYLQSAGSLGKDASKGILLRWFFLRNLGNTHLPKGDHSINTAGFNKPNDYVCIYRAEYNPMYLSVDIYRPTPINFDEAKRRWIYQMGGLILYVHFLDETRYQQIRSGLNPITNPQQFITAYGDGLLELELQNELAFSITPKISGASDGYFQLEVHSVQGNLPLNESGITARKLLKVGEPDRWKTISENIKKVQFRSVNCELEAFEIELYSRALIDRVRHQGWLPLGRFALSKDDDTVLESLEDESRFQVHEHWQKYNDDAFVNIQNYKARWDTIEDNLKAGVDKYLELSETDPSATESISDEENIHSMDVSYFDILQVASLDYHIARMLGLGYIDTPQTERENKYIYLAEYFTFGKLDTQLKEAPRQHLYMTLPTGLADERMPQKIETLPVSYGLELYNGTSNPTQLTDANGYLPFEPTRYINVNARPVKDYSQQSSFFQPNWEFESAHFSPAVLSGVEYKKQGEASWQAPEISHDENFSDASVNELPETVALPFPDDSTKPILTHEETREGIHEYAAYSINIFSRAAEIHNSVFTDYTRFVKPNTLLPPHNLRVQLIQDENPRLLTTAREQEMLSSLTSNDKTLVRLSFRYNHLHDINYQFGDKVEVFFRSFVPRNVEGGIASIIDDVNDRYAIVSTQSYTFNSTGETIMPNIPASLYPNFIGGVLVIGEGRYIIEDIISTNPNGDLPRFKVKKLEDRNAVDLGGGNIVLNQLFLSPSAEVGDLFMVIENMAQASSWGSQNPLAYTIDLGTPAWSNQTEVIEDDESGTIERELRGIWGEATIAEKVDPSTQSIIPGFYDVEFNNFQLGHHPQWLDSTVNPNIGANFVEWYQGILRVNISTDVANEREKKTLDVVKIINVGTSSNLKLVVHDESYQTEAIKTGTNVLVNFYPGYRAYLHADTPDGFDEDTILPAVGEGAKQSLLGLRSLDSSTLDAFNEPYHSKIGTPQILYAQEIINPLPPKLPSGPAYATPPDFYSKSTYTFTTEFEHKPFGAVFYRADVNAVLKALYTTETYQQILAALPSPDQDEFYSDRIQAITNASFDMATRKFIAFPLGDNDEYAFPEPDNPDNAFPSTATNAGELQELIRTTVYSVFIPLTEQPLIYDLVKGGDYIPTPKKQTIRDKYGKLLNPTDTEYDLAPMAKRKDSSGNIRFTDFTLDGEMGTGTAYLYCVRELGNRMSLSEPSEILGPIQLINKNPPESPVVKKMTAQLEDAITGNQTAVNFQVNGYSVSQNIKRFQIYRAIRAVDALSPRTMVLAKEVELSASNIIDGIIHLQDDFSDVDIIPYGEALFYRLVALREVIYDNIDGDRVIEYVPSKPTKRLLTNIVDVNNPAPPTIEKVAGDLIDDEIIGLSLKWNKTAHNATYYLFKMNSVGNWNKLTEISSNDETELLYTFSHPVPKTDEDGDTIYHRFKVTVENSSGLLNLPGDEKILTL